MPAPSMLFFQENDMQWDRREKTWCLRKCEAMRAAPRLERASHITTARQSPLLPLTQQNLLSSDNTKDRQE